MNLWHLTYAVDASMSSRMAPSPIPMTDDNRRQLELWCNTLNRKLMENPIEDISNYALMALLREKYDPGRVIDALLEAKSMIHHPSNLTNVNHHPTTTAGMTNGLLPSALIGLNRNPLTSSASALFGSTAPIVTIPPPLSLPPPPPPQPSSSSLSNPLLAFSHFADLQNAATWSQFAAVAAASANNGGSNQRSSSLGNGNITFHHGGNSTTASPAFSHPRSYFAGLFPGSSSTTNPTTTS
ncbi:hypothetical protein DERP_004185, partial [Dermatophagoides pteronyssinus]